MHCGSSDRQGRSRSALENDIIIAGYGEIEREILQRDTIVRERPHGLHLSTPASHSTHTVTVLHVCVRRELAHCDQVV